MLALLFAALARRYIAAMSVLVPTLIVVATVLLMEAGAYASHRWIMHGWGWGWHRSHHEEREGAFEKNDLYALCFALVAIVLFAAGTAIAFVWWVAVGVTAYGALYFIFHDGLVHHRWLFRTPPRRGYLKRLYQAHRLHHAVHGREGAVSFGFLYAPPIEELKKELQVGRPDFAAPPRNETPRPQR